ASVSSTISASTPAAGEGTSWVTLSVSSSTSGSFSATASPIWRSQARTTALVPSCSAGTRTSTITSEAAQPLHRGADALARRQRRFHQLGVMRARDVGHGDSRDRSVEIEEGFVGDHRGDLRAEAAGAQILVDDQAPARAAHAVEHHLLVPRLERAKIDDIGAEPVG